MDWRALDQIKSLFPPVVKRALSPKAKTIGDKTDIAEAADVTDQPQCPDAVLISVIGMAEAERDRMLDWMPADCAANAKLPVFVTDDLDLHPWLSRELLVEHLPSMARQKALAPDLDWDLYLKRRLDFLKRKWRVDHIMDLGKSLDRLSETSERPGNEPGPARSLASSQ